MSDDTDAVHEQQQPASGPLPTQQQLTLAEAAQRLRSGDLTSAELVADCLHRIAQLDGALQACVTVLGESARTAAQAADVQLQQKRRGQRLSPLFGIPIGVKDLIEMAGILTTAGSRVLDDWIPDADATVVTKLYAAGAIPIAKTNTHEFAWGVFTPPTRNPWDTSRVPGGSSGGSAAALVAGMCLGALGTDTGGSIRIPAACCGVTGLKPTYGLISRAGIVTLSWSLDHAGPMARTVEDCALLLDALAGHDRRDPDSVEVPLLNYSAALADGRAPEDAARGTRIGVPTSFFFNDVDPDIEAGVRDAIAVFERLGASMREVKLPAMLDADFFTNCYRAIQRPEASLYHHQMGWATDRVGRYTPATRASIELGASVPASVYINGQRMRQAFTSQMRDLFSEVDALITPTILIPAPRIDALDEPVTIDGREEGKGYALLRNCFPFDITGQPALSLPCGFTRDGLPIGLQLAANTFNEATLLRLGHAYQRVTNWHTRQPGQ